MKKITLCLLLAASAGLAKAQCNRVVNGDFSAGNTGFTSDYVANCSDPSGYMPASAYCVTDNASNPHSLFTSCSDIARGNFMVVNAAVTQKNAGLYDVVWSQTVSVTPNTNYTFSVEAASVYPLNPAMINLHVNGSSSGATVLDAASCSWKTLTYVWNSGSNTTATLSITDDYLEPNGNDFALDNITFHGGSVLTLTSVEDEDCSVSGTGSITVSATSGEGPYVFTITTANTTFSFNSISNVFTFLGLLANTNATISVMNACGDVSTLSSSVPVGKKVPMAHMTGSKKNPCVNICVAAPAVPAHLGHGDYVGTCSSSAARIVHTTMLDNIQVVPNPNAGIFKLNLPLLETNASMHITDIQGRIVRQAEIDQDARTIDINMKDFGKGVYFVSVFDGDHNYRSKFVVE